MAEGTRKFNIYDITCDEVHLDFTPPHAIQALPTLSEVRWLVAAGSVFEDVSVEVHVVIRRERAEALIDRKNLLTLIEEAEAAEATYRSKAEEAAKGTDSRHALRAEMFRLAAGRMKEGTNFIKSVLNHDPIYAPFDLTNDAVDAYFYRPGAADK